MPKQKKAPAPPTSPLPDQETLLKFIQENPDRAGKRELARAFGLKGGDRIWLKQMLKDLENDGLVEKRGRRFQEPGSLPPVTVLNITTRDRDGDLLAKPIEWEEAIHGKPPTITVLRSKKGPVAGIGDRVLARTNRVGGAKSARYTARVMKIIGKSERTILGVFRADKSGDGGRLEPVDRRQDELTIASADAGEAKDGDLVEVEARTSGRYGLKRAAVSNVLGSMNSEKAVSMIAIHAHGIPHIFPEEALREAEAAKEADFSNREDWRDLPLITIDPATAKDHDDAVCAVPDDDPKNESGFVVTVAIADVSHYVRPGSALDREALKRGNSVYFPDRVVPMLPERISNELCSLKEGVDRPALAVVMRFSAKGQKISHSFHRIMMRNPVRLAYEEAQAAFDGQPNERAAPFVEQVLEPLLAAYHCLNKGRAARSPLELELPERRIVLNDNDEVDRVIVPPRLAAHRLIEDFMIQANVAAAETLERKKQDLIYRIHDAPSLQKLESLRDFLKTLDLSLVRPGNLRPEHFNGILRGVDGTPHEELVNQVILRSQSQAEYSPENIGHFGLHLARYAHFTSPIRRYADLIVHRALVSALGLGPGGLGKMDRDTLDGISQEISDSERRAASAERDTVDRLIAQHLADKVGAEFAARINGVSKSGVFVTLHDTGADGFIPISQLGEEYFIFDEATRSVVGEQTRTAHRVGDDVVVKLVEALPLAGALRFELISGGKTVAKLPDRSRRGKSFRDRRNSRSGPPRGTRKSRKKKR
ncbi:MAG: ribonuclease R [Pseudomonadota bacterium]